MHKRTFEMLAFYPFIFIFVACVACGLKHYRLGGESNFVNSLMSVSGSRGGNDRHPLLRHHNPCCKESIIMHKAKLDINKINRFYDGSL